MRSRLIYAIGILALLIAVPASHAAAENLGEITEIRGKKIILYAAPDGRKSERIDVKSLGTPLSIPVTGHEQNGRYPVEVEGKTGWIGKAQAKTTTFKVDKGIAAKCQSVTTSYASTRGFGNCK